MIDFLGIGSQMKKSLNQMGIMSIKYKAIKLRKENTPLKEELEI